MNSVVSIIIPAYNAEKYLAECLDSVLNQSYKCLEIIVVNDGSIDGTREILDAYASEYNSIRAIHTENRGVSCARNTGLNEASGDYVMFLDSDDFIALNAVEILMKDISENDADVASGTMSAGVGCGACQINDGTFEVWQGSEALKQSLLDNPFTYSSCAKLYKREFLDGVRFAEGRKIHEDSYFVFSVFLKEPKVVIREAAIYNYRPNPNSASHADFSEKYFDILYFANLKYDTVKERYPELIKYSENMLVKSNIAMLQCFLKADSKQYRKDIKSCIRTVKRYAGSFVPTYPGDKKRFMIVRYNLFGVYKILFRIKYR